MPKSRGAHNCDPGYSVDPSGCWMYLGHVRKDGYCGCLKAPDGTYQNAPRVYYMRAKGAIPKGYHVDHLCRHPRCVNPEHLEAVLPKVNTRRGEAAKLTDADVAWIRQHVQLRPQGNTRIGRVAISQSLAARKYGVTQGLISMILSGQRWV
jgi:hypothetical protein